MTSNIVKVTVADDSSMASGQSFRLSKGFYTSFEEFQADVRHILHFEPLLHKIEYADSESEKIEIIDDADWQTCLDELQALNNVRQTEGIKIYVSERQITAKRKSVQLKSTVITDEGAGGQSKLESSSFVEVNNDVSRVEKQIEEKPDISDKDVPKPKEKVSSTQAQIYKFKYTDDEMEEVRRVSPILFSKIENIFANKYEESLLESERNFQAFLEQKLKQKVIEFQNKFDQLSTYYNNELDKMKKEPQLVKEEPVILCKEALIKPAQINEEPLTVQSQAQSKIFSNASITIPSNLPATNSPSKDMTSKTPTLAPFTHYGVACDGCGDFPLRGIRYKAVHKRNYDICEKCFRDDTRIKEGYLALRESEPQEFNQLVTLARNAQIPNYSETNRHMLKLHKWENDFKDLEHREKALKFAIDHSFM